MPDSWRHGARVLVVDDDADIRLLLRHLMATSGFSVEEAAGGDAALARMADTLAPRPDVLVLDVQMPGADGWDVLGAVRAAPATADVAVVLCTVKSSPRDVVRGWELGCDAYVSKPFDTDELVTVVRDVLSLDQRTRVARRKAALERVASRAADDTFWR